MSSPNLSTLSLEVPPLKHTGSFESSATSSKLVGLHEWLSFENRRVKHWWNVRSTDIHKIYLNQVHGTDELRSQLNEQLRALDCRIDTQCALVAELQDWFRRRAELHQDYSIKLDKLSKSLFARHKEQKIKEQWSLFSVYNCWQILVNETKKDARDHAAMADVYLNNIIPRFTQVQEDVQRIYKKCRDIGYESHEELLKVLHELHTTMRTYHMYQAEFKSAEGKLQNLEAQKAKLELNNPKEKLEKRKKFKVIEKEIEKRKSKYRDAKLKALKARNEYILSMDSANAAIRKYFVEDLSDIVDCMDFGFHSSIAKALMTHISGQECFKRTLHNGIDDLSKSINNMDSRHDKQRFLEYNNAAFMLPKKFDFQGYKGDDLNQVLVTHPIQEEMEKRYVHLVSRLTNLKTESEETWKTIETAEKTLLSMINARDYDIAHYFADEPVRVETKTPEAAVVKRKADRQETEEFYLGKFRDYTLGSNLICRLEARFGLMRKALGNDESQTMPSPTPTRSLASKPRRRRIGRTPLTGQPRLFGGSLEEYLEATAQEVPLIMKSCIRVINLYGLHHQGIFRVSGSQVEINNFRETFEKMEDPLADVTDASDINSIAGVLKLYLRELREPIFPTVYFDQFMEIAQMESKQDFVSKVREVVINLPRPVFVVMRYLFAFLNHLSEFSDENMMDPYNLAICFGPTLVPIPEDKDQVQYQNLVNELIKNIIIFFEDIFPYDTGPIYEKFISRDSIDLDAEMGDAPADDPDTGDSEEPGQSEDDSVFRDPITLQLFGKSEVLEASAQFDFCARSARELSFKKGDVLLLQAQVSSDWWRGSFAGKTGLIPDKYILLKIRDEDKERPSSDRGSSEEPPSGKRRASSSSESATTASSVVSSEACKGAPPNGSTPPTAPQNIPFTHPPPELNTSPAMLDCHSLGGSSSPVPSLSSMSSIGVSEHPDSPPEASGPLIGSPGGGLVRLTAATPVAVQEEACADTWKGSPVSSFLKEDLKSLLSDATSGASPSPSSSSKVRLVESPSLRLSESVLMRAPESSPLRMCASLTEPFGDAAAAGILWRCPSRASTSSTSSLSSTGSEERASRRIDCEGLAKGKPDLVMDLPVTSLSSSPKDNVSVGAVACEPYGRQVVPIGDMTAAECFAKQNQSTLKKSNAVTKSHSSAAVVVGGGCWSDAQTQTLSPSVKILTSMSTDELRVVEEPEREVREPVAKAYVAPTVRTAREGDAAPPSDEVIVEVRAAADLAPPSDAVLVTGPPSTPKLAARYLKAVAASGGGSGVAVKPQVRVKPTVLKKPTVPLVAVPIDADATNVGQ